MPNVISHRLVIRPRMWSPDSDWIVLRFMEATVT